MVTYQVEKLADMLDELKPLLEDHYDEISMKYSPLNPDYDKYIMVEEMGMLRVVTARKDGQLVGYFITFVHYNMHYRDMIYGVNDIVYIQPEYRGSSVGYRLFKYAIDDLIENMVVSVIVIHMKIKYEFRHLLTGLGFVQTEELWELKVN